MTEGVVPELVTLFGERAQLAAIAFAFERRANHEERERKIEPAREIFETQQRRIEDRVRRARLRRHRARGSGGKKGSRRGRPRRRRA